jgi:serine/threonine protein kinase
MSRNEQIARWLNQRSMVAPETLRAALQFAQQSDADLCDVLIERGVLKEEWRAAINQAALSFGSAAIQKRRPKTGSKRRPTEAMAETASAGVHSRSTASQADQLEFLGYDGIDRYSIQGEIGRGGMGKVYLATVKATGNEVVIKTLLQLKKGKNRVERFRREAVALAQLNHPHIVRIHDFRLSGTSPGGESLFPYLVMERIQGKTLGDYIEDKFVEERLQVDYEGLRQLFVKLAKALIYCHEKGIMHRDLKPSNVLIESPGDGQESRPVLIDFGLVKMDPDKLRESLEVNDGLTQAGQTIGSPAFAAPEQLHGEVDKYGERTDVWGLGACLYFSLCGQVPYKVSSVYELYGASRKRSPHRVRRVDSRVPGWLDSLCAACLQRESSDRPSMAEVLASLEEKRGSKSPRSKAVLAALAFFSLLVLIVTAGLLQSIDRKPPILDLGDYPKIVSNRRVRLSGKITDEGPVFLHIKSKKKNGRYKEFPVNADGTFSIELDVVEGRNRFLLKGRDGSGNLSTILPIVVRRDSKAPTFKVKTMEKSTYRSEIFLEGSVDEEFCTVVLGDQQVAANGRRFKAQVKLRPGWNQIQVGCMDSVGNKTEQVLRIERLPTLHVQQSATDEQSFRTIQGAINAANPRTRIFVHPGVYEESLTIEKELRLIGVGERSAVVLRSLTVGHKVTASKVVLKKLSLESRGEGGAGQALIVLGNDCLLEGCQVTSLFKQAVVIGSSMMKAKSEVVKGLVLKDCVVQNSGMAGVSVSFGSEAQFLSCVFRKNAHSGVFVTAWSKAKFSDCRFEENRDGIGVLQRGEISVNRSSFLDNKGEGVWVDDRSVGLLVDCKFKRNGRWEGSSQRPGVNAMADSTLTAKSCEISEGFGVGGLAQDGGILRLRNCKLLKNRSAGLAAQRRGRVFHFNCDIRENLAGPFYTLGDGKIILGR